MLSFQSAQEPGNEDELAADETQDIVRHMIQIQSKADYTDGQSKKMVITHKTISQI